MPESLNDALVACVVACGGSKVVGVALWPPMGVEAAQRKLLASLNPERNEKLGPDEVLALLRMARDRGCHVGMQYLAAALSYADPVPIEPKDEADQLRREVLEMGRDLHAKLDRLERMSPPPGPRLAT